MSNLPEARLAINQSPSTNTGINYFGPLTEDVHVQQMELLRDMELFLLV